MKKQNKLILSAALVGGMAMMSVGTARGTILPFSGGTTTISNGTFMNAVADYGDNVTTATSGGFTFTAGTEGWTPNVTLDFGGSTAKYTQSALTTAVYAKNSTSFPDKNFIRITFTAAAGYKVHLYDMSVSANGSNRTADSITINDGTSDIYLANSSQNSSALAAQSGVASTVSFGASGVEGQVLTLAIDLTTDHSTDYYMSNLRFGQSVPEPASLGLMGLAGLAMLRRRRQA